MLENVAGTWLGISSLLLFIVAYILVIFEDQLKLRKSKPMVLFGCVMWALIGLYEAIHGIPGASTQDFLVELTAEIGELFFFLLVAMTFVNTLAYLNVFEALRYRLVSKKLGCRSLFWATGGITFCLSPFCDNLTAALLMATVAQTACRDKRFIVPAFVNIVVAANAGGAWSPFGDITTLMVWAAKKVPTLSFLHLMLPSIVNWLVPAIIMSFFVPKAASLGSAEKVEMKPGAWITIFLGITTLAMAVIFQNFLNLPPYLGMMLGLGFLMMVGYASKNLNLRPRLGNLERKPLVDNSSGFDVFQKIKNVEFDTLFFFFGVLIAVGALQFLGYLVFVGEALYGTFGNTAANILIGLFSAIGDNIPVMYAVLKMDPNMDVKEWLLVTLTTGVGGSLLSIGSAAGVAVMGVNREEYTFTAHLKYSLYILLGYFASIITWALLA